MVYMQPGDSYIAIISYYYAIVSYMGTVKKTALRLSLFCTHHCARTHRHTNTSKFYTAFKRQAVECVYVCRHFCVPSVQVIRISSHEMVKFFHLTIHGYVAEIKQRIQAAISQLQGETREREREFLIVGRYLILPVEI